MKHFLAYKNDKSKIPWQMFQLGSHSYLFHHCKNITDETTHIGEIEEGCPRCDETIPDYLILAAKLKI